MQIKKILLIALLAACSSVMAAEKVKLTSLDWPPYTSEALKEKGASAAVAKAAFAAVGYDLTIEFYPWKRVVVFSK